MHVELTGFYINKHEVNAPVDSLFLNELTQGFFQWTVLSSAAFYFYLELQCF